MSATASAVFAVLFGWLAWRSWSKGKAAVREWEAWAKTQPEWSRAHNPEWLAKHPGGTEEDSALWRSRPDDVGPAFFLWFILAVLFGVGALVVSAL